VTGSITLARTVKWLRRLDTIDVALRLTLLDLLLRPIGSWPIRPMTLMLAGAGLLFPWLLRRPSLWGGLALLTLVRFVADWPLADNHAYLLCYWCVAVALSLFADDTHACLSFNGRLLIGLVFGFAILWKLALSADFLDGTFFRVHLMLDPRLEDWTALVTGWSAEGIDTYRAALRGHFDAPLAAIPPGTALPIRFERVADAATWWTASIEAAVCASFCWWRPGRIAGARHALLLVFCATTYIVAPVDGFGYLLVAMGFAQCEPDRGFTRGCYLAVFALILLYREIPLARLLSDAFVT